MICNQCKKEVEVDKWQFCPHCGCSLKDEKIFFLLRKIFSSKRNLAFFIIADSLIIGIAFFFLASSYYQLEIRNREISELIEKIEEVRIETKFEEKIMPITYYGDNKKMAELRVSSQIFGKIRIESEVSGITRPEIQVIDIKPGNKIHYISPEITEEGYRNLSDSKRTDIYLKAYLLKDNGEEKQLLQEKKELFFYSKNDIIWKEKDGTDNSKYVVRLINKDRDEIKELVRKASDHIKKLGGDSNSMEGIFADKINLKRQLEAIFLAISEDYQIHYVMSPFSYDDNSVQKIKDPEEVIKTRSGLCIELSLLIAAALENVGLNAVIAIVPGHAWVGVETGPRSGDYIFIETTVLEKKSGEALYIAQKNWNKFKNMPGSYRILNVNELRAEGLLPIKY